MSVWPMVGAICFVRGARNTTLLFRVTCRALCACCVSRCEHRESKLSAKQNILYLQQLIGLYWDRFGPPSPPSRLTMKPCYLQIDRKLSPRVYWILHNINLGTCGLSFRFLISAGFSTFDEFGDIVSLSIKRTHFLARLE